LVIVVFLASKVFYLCILLKKTRELFFYQELLENLFDLTSPFIE
jgi:hypothetical protein